MVQRVRARTASKPTSWIMRDRSPAARALVSSRCSSPARAAKRRGRASARRCCRAWRRTAGCTCRSEWPVARRDARGADATPAGAGAQSCSRRSSRAMRWPARLPAITARGLQFSGAAASRSRRRAARRARAVSRPDRGVQGFRRALPGGLPGAPARGRGAAAARSWWRPPATPAARSPPRFIAGPASRSSVLFPKGLVSPTQEQQLTCWGDNVQSLAVRGTLR